MDLAHEEIGVTTESSGWNGDGVMERELMAGWQHDKHAGDSFL